MFQGTLFRFGVKTWETRTGEAIFICEHIADHNRWFSIRLHLGVCMRTTLSSMKRIAYESWEHICSLNRLSIEQQKFAQSMSLLPNEIVGMPAFSLTKRTCRSIVLCATLSGTLLAELDLIVLPRVKQCRHNVRTHQARDLRFCKILQNAAPSIQRQVF